MKKKKPLEITDKDKRFSAWCNGDKEVAICANCTHFHQHYVRDGTGYGLYQYIPTPYGHCVFPRMKNRNAYDTCKHFKRGG